MASRTRNLLLTGLRAPAERGNALPKSTWTVLRHITVCPWRIGAIVATALVLTTCTADTGEKTSR